MILNVDLVYPVGSIYMNYSNSTNSGVLFGGTWEAITYRYLVGVGPITPNSNNAVGSVDAYVSAGYTVSPKESFGEMFHTLTINEIPPHSHTIGIAASDGWNNSIKCAGTPDTTNRQTWSAGGGAAHNNLPPSLAVYMWRRTA